MSSFVKYCAVILLTGMYGREAAAVSIEFTSPAATIVVEDGKRFALVEGGQNVSMTARATGSEMLNAFQLNFENSVDALHLQNWVTGPAWPLPIDSTLQSASNDYLVAASTITPNTLPVLLGTFQVGVPDVQNDLLLTVDSGPGPFGTGFTNASGALPISDYGDLVIRVRPDPPAIAGDYDRNGSVGSEDFVRWKSTFGSMASLDADGNNNGVVDAADYTIWRDALGTAAAGFAATSSLSAGSNIPEPASCLLLMSGIVGCVLISRRFRWTRRD